MYKTLTQWLLNEGFHILIISFVAVFVRRNSKLPIKRFIKSLMKAEKFSNDGERMRREETLRDIVYASLGVVIYAIAFTMILSILEINIQPLLASAGVLGVALGFGGQWLIRDVISGIFIITENQYRVGDVVTLNTGSVQISGTVEDISLRLTELRDLDGQLFHVPNGIIQVAGNKSKDFAGINLDIDVAYDSDLKLVQKVVNEVGAQLAEDKEWKKHIIETPRFLRVDRFSERSVVIKIVGKTEPLKQWSVSGELRLRLNDAFREHKIKMPYFSVASIRPMPNTKK